MIIVNRTFQAFLDKMDRITILLPYHYNGGQASSFKLVNGEELDIYEKEDIQQFVKYHCQLKSSLDFGKTHYIVDNYGGTTDLQIGAVIRTDEFDNAFYYAGDLGAFYKREATHFKVWAPTATKVKLKLYDPEEKELEPISMIREEKGVWSVTVHQNLEYYHYSFLACINLKWNEAVDPYTKAVNLNGSLGVIVDLRKTAVKKYEPPPLEHFTDSIIYETHIRDVTIHPNSGVKAKGTYLGLCENNTKNQAGCLTGLSYIAQLGVTHVEFLPFNDFEGVDETNAKQYNWGYNPLHFNVPEGSYSTQPADPYRRIIELKTLIQTCHQAKLRVIMDVVYNHVYVREKSSFEKLVPGYYFRHDEFGMPSNGTGVGNDIASERKMVRKFILDSILYWIQEYDIDGLRFDLMGILDVDTMNFVRKKVDEWKEMVLIIGEGWDLNTPLPQDQKATIKNESKIARIGQFNDWFRDTVKGSTFHLNDKGFAFGNMRYKEAAKEVVAGSIGLEKKEKGIFSEPFHSINYVESHDNHTLWDKLAFCMDDTVEMRRKYHRLATAMVLLAQGIPFLHSGQEFFRTKKGVENSYKSSDDINFLDWDLMSENRGNVEYMKGLIRIRKAHQAFRLPTASAIRSHVKCMKTDGLLLGMEYQHVGNLGPWSQIIILFHPEQEQSTIFTFPSGEWHILANDNQASMEPITVVKNGIITLKPVSLVVAVKI